MITSMPTDFAETLHERMLTNEMTIATAESCTVGLIMSHVGSCSGSSAYFKGGICAYDQDAKVMLLGVDAEHASEVNCVSEQVAREMAEGARNRFGADIGVATTGYAEPWPDGGVSRPMVWIAVATNDGCKTLRYEAHANYDEDDNPWWEREEVQEEFAERAILLVLRHAFNIVFSGEFDEDDDFEPPWSDA